MTLSEIEAAVKQWEEDLRKEGCTDIKHSSGDYGFTRGIKWNDGEKQQAHWVSMVLRDKDHCWGAILWPGKDKEPIRENYD